MKREREYGVTMLKSRKLVHLAKYGQRERETEKESVRHKEIVRERNRDQRKTEAKYKALSQQCQGETDPSSKS